MIVLWMPFFPFLNMTAIYIVLGIGADDFVSAPLALSWQPSATLRMRCLFDFVLIVCVV